MDYSYDNIGQLKIADSSVSSEDRGYTYDAAWNLNWRTNNGVASQFKVNVLNELTNGPVGNLSYDSNGNLTGIGSQKVFMYDDENRLVRWYSYQGGVNSPATGDKQTVFVYDGLGRLRARQEYTLSCTGGGGSSAAQQPSQANSGGNTNCTWNLSSETHYVYDGWRVIQERDGSNVPTVSYTRGNDLSMSLEGAGGIGGLLARSSGYSAGNWTSHADYFADGNGNVTSLIDGSQSVVASYRYDPFGTIISKSGTLADANVYRFSSKEVHVNSGMYYYGFRFYEPNLQRWVNRDPIEEYGGFNLYGFAFNSPVNAVDVYGLIDLWHLFSDPTFMDSGGSVHYGTPPSEQQSTFDPNSYLGQRGTDNGMFGGCQARDFITENAQKAIQDAAETMAAMMPIGEGGEMFNAGEKMMKAKRLADAIKKRDSLKAAAEFAAQHAKELKDKMLKAADEMGQLEHRFDLPRTSKPYEDAVKAWRALQNELTKTNQALKKYLDDLKAAEANVKSCE